MEAYYEEQKPHQAQPRRKDFLRKDVQTGGSFAFPILDLRRTLGGWFRKTYAILLGCAGGQVAVHSVRKPGLPIVGLKLLIDALASVAGAYTGCEVDFQV